MKTSAQPSAMTGATDDPVDISIIIPAYHGDATIAACLASVQRATEGHRAEIIVVDSSGDRCGEIVREQFPEVILVLSPTRLSAGAARNRGIAMARGRILFFVDQDCVVPPDWIAALEKHFADPAIGGAGGSLGILNPECLTGCGVYFLEFFRHFPQNRPPLRNRNFLLGCNSAYRAELLRAGGIHWARERRRLFGQQRWSMIRQISRQLARRMACTARRLPRNFGRPTIASHLAATTAAPQPRSVNNTRS